MNIRGLYFCMFYNFYKKTIQGTLEWRKYPIKIQNNEKFSRTCIQKRFLHSILIYGPTQVNLNFMKIAKSLIKKVLQYLPTYMLEMVVINQ